MTTRTLAATAAALPQDTLDRRTMLASAGAAAVLAAIGAPAVAEVDLDAPLWELRTRWRAARTRFQTAMDECDISIRAAHRLPGWAAANHSERAVLKVLVGLDKAEARQEQASAADTIAVEEIAALPARTLAGVGFKVEVSGDWEHDHEALTASIMADVAAFASTHPMVRI